MGGAISAEDATILVDKKSEALGELSALLDTYHSEQFLSTFRPLAFVKSITLVIEINSSRCGRIGRDRAKICCPEG